MRLVPLRTIGTVVLIAPLAYFGCVGDEPTAMTAVQDAGTSTPEQDATTGTSDSGKPDLDPDAAPPAGCPLGCLPPAPNGWTGPSAVYDGDPATKPADCPALYTQPEVEGHQGLAADPAQCSCGAPAFQGSFCSADVEGWPQAGCNTGTPLLEGTVTSTACLVSTNGTSAYVRVATPTITRGTCTYPSAQKTVPSPTFQKANIACGLPQRGTCESRTDCTAAPLPAAPFTRLCIHKTGDESCPSADYANRFVVFTDVSDDRSCDACTGTTANGSCGSAWGKSNAAACMNGPAPTDLAANACVGHSGIGMRVNIAAMAPTGITCTPTGGAPIGTATSTAPVTFCCNK